MLNLILVQNNLHFKMKYAKSSMKYAKLAALHWTQLIKSDTIAMHAKYGFLFFFSKSGHIGQLGLQKVRKSGSLSKMFT